MHHPRLFTMLRAWLDRRNTLVRCPVVVRHYACLLAALLLLGPATHVSASVLVTGNVTPADNPFTTSVNEGLPTDGNFVNPFENPDHQTYFEGRHTDGSDPFDIADDTNENFNIFVGKTSFGTMLISGESALRDMNLVIGDSGLVNNVTRYGTGVVRITGFGSLYNNDFNIIPDGLPMNFASQSPRAAAMEMDGLDGPDAGFDLYVGKTGTGTLEISAGARAEIQDAVIVGDTPTSTGTILVDGFDSFLGSGGFATSNTGGSGSGVPDPHEMRIGRQGVGYLTVTNGATVSSFGIVHEGGSGSGSQVDFGAVIGGEPAEFNGNPMNGGGVGTVTINGGTASGGTITSKWIVGGSLQVGGFSARGTINPISLNFDIEGDETLYSNAAGRGTLNVLNGGLVNVISTDTNTTNPQDLYLLVGQFGRIYLNGGTINVGGVPGDTGQPTQGRDRRIRVINDGVITGSGSIITGTFLNRYLGEVRVEAGQSLVIDAATDFRSPQVGEPNPLTNYGRINVYGTVDARAELEFLRLQSNPEAANQPFYNLPLPPDTPIVAPAFEGGQISAQYATLRFHSGIQNQGVMAFTAGTNYVSGQVVNVSNEFASPDGTDTGDSTQILVSGPSTQVVFEDDLATTPGTDVNLFGGGKVVVLDQHSFAAGGNIGIDLSYSNPSLITVAGDVGIGAGAGFSTDLSINLASDVLHSLQHGDSFEIIAFGGDIGGVDLTDPLHPVVDLTTNPLFTDIEVSPDLALFHPELVLNIQFGFEGVYATFLDPSMIGVGAVGPDFNGDGVIDNADLAIWLAHVGIESGASVLDGDADGDGDVDGDDFLFWQRNVGQPMPWTGSGSAAAVPEPATAMLLMVGLLALPAWRRRTAR